MARDICVAVGERVRHLRTLRGWRQIDLAQHSGISETYVSHVETGKKELCLRNLELLAKSFEQTLSQFLDGL